MGLLRTAGFALFGYALLAAFRLIVGLMLPGLTSEFRLTPIESGFFASAPLLASVLTTALAGYVSDRMGRKSTFTVSMLVLWTGAVLSALSTDYLLALFFIFVAGVGAAFLTPTIYSIMGNLRPKSRGSLVGYAASSYNFGGFAASVGLGFVITLSGWRIGLATLAGLGLVYIPVMFFLMGPAASLQGPRQDLRPSGSSDSRLLKSRNALFASSSLLMAAYASFTITSWTPAYLIHIGVKSSLTGVVIGAYALAGGVAAIVSGRLADAWGEKRLMMCTGTGAAAVSIPLYLLGLNFSSALVLMAAVGFLLWPYWNLAISMVQRLVDPVMVGSMTGLVLNIGMVGGFLGPTLTGILIDYFGFGPAMAGSVVVSLCLYVLLIAPFREATRENREYVVQA